MFLLLMAIGVVGLLALVLPGLVGQGHGGHGAGHAGAGHGLGAGGLKGAAALKAASARTASGSTGGGRSALLGHLVPEPRTALSFVALLGAFGNVAERLWHLPFWPALAMAAPAAVVLELGLVRPIWRLALRFQGRPQTSLHALVLEEAVATTEFRNGKGLVQVVRDGRQVQLSARLSAGQEELAVKVGDRLRVEDVDPEAERVTVSVD